ncbi:hypothetical protein B0H34DRAFT_796052 [Crassisporium funariophilum]|nr:hypothetical protein B0H34DRAFT_796052 [Crassisporium funariophilum]
MLSEFRPNHFSTAARSGLRSHTLVTNALRLSWVVVVIIGELGAFFWSLSACRWPKLDLGHKNVKPTHVLLLADTQVQHVALTAKGSWGANPIRRVMFELNLRKSWHVTSRLKPHAVIFLGDMLANGKAARTAEEYKQATQKFKSIFPVDPGASVHYIPGNNDIGLGQVPSVTKTLRSYYLDSFGPFHQDFKIANHTFVGIDAPGIVDEDYQRHAKYVSFDDWKPIANGPVSFVKDVAEYDPSYVILLSHIPLSRSETASCGPLREKGTIRRGAGPGYQSMLGKQTTNFLLRNLSPLIIFSADNRDYCDYTHVLPGDPNDSYNQGNKIREVTLKSFAMSVHIKRPGFQLLSLIDPTKVGHEGSLSFADTPCFLPDQYRIYTSFYTPAVLITLLMLVFLNLGRTRPRPLRKLDSASRTPSPRSSGRSTPIPMGNPDSALFSATWSPYSPAVHVSPRGTLPSYLRTPHTPSGSTTMLVASRPGTPTPSSPSSHTMLTPFGDHDEEEEDTMYPTQYAVQRDGHKHRDEDDWSHVRHGREEDEDFEAVAQEAGSLATRMHSQFISAPDHRHKSRKWLWSYSFALMGRRRRVTLRLPSWNSLHNLIDLFGFGGPREVGINIVGRRRRDGWIVILLDTLSVFWPAVVVWVIINWTIL